MRENALVHVVDLDGRSFRAARACLPWAPGLALALLACASSPAAPDASPGAGAPCDPRAPVCIAGEQCTATRWDLEAPWPQPRCAPPGEAVPGAAGDVCFALAGELDTCGPGLSCTNFGTGEGFCAARCSESGSRCPAASGCALVDARSGFALCLLACESDADCPLPVRQACIDYEDQRFCDAARAAR